MPEMHETRFYPEQVRDVFVMRFDLGNALGGAGEFGDPAAVDFRENRLLDCNIVRVIDLRSRGGEIACKGVHIARIAHHASAAGCGIGEAVLIAEPREKDRAAMGGDGHRRVEVVPPKRRVFVDQ